MNKTLTIAMSVLVLTIGACAKKNDSATTGPATPETSAPSDTATADTAAAPVTPPAQDQGFFDKAAEGGMAEVEAGTLAQQKASSSDVKKFGAMMVTDHTAANEKLKGIAAQHSVMLPADLNTEHHDMKARLSSLTGKEFDKEYVRGQIMDHQATVELLRTESTSGENPDAKAFATETLPTVEAHLKKAQDLGKKLGIDAH